MIFIGKRCNPYRFVASSRRFTTQWPTLQQWATCLMYVDVVFCSIIYFVMSDDHTHICIYIQYNCIIIIFWFSFGFRFRLGYYHIFTISLIRSLLELLFARSWSRASSSQNPALGATSKYQALHLQTWPMVCSILAASAVGTLWKASNDGFERSFLTCFFGSRGVDHGGKKLIDLNVGISSELNGSANG